MARSATQHRQDQASSLDSCFGFEEATAFLNHSKQSRRKHSRSSRMPSYFWEGYKPLQCALHPLFSFFLLLPVVYWCQLAPSPNSVQQTPHWWHTAMWECIHNGNLKTLHIRTYIFLESPLLNIDQFPVPITGDWGSELRGNDVGSLEKTAGAHSKQWKWRIAKIDSPSPTSCSNINLGCNI